jgi:ubiquinone/menaquinone biosynthesis C-methylase UbiE
MERLRRDIESEMQRRVPDYDQLSSTYDSRYGENRLDGIAAALVKVSREADARTILEVGCGTGRWFESLRAGGATVIGVDASTGMLGRAVEKRASTLLAAARANELPFAGRRFDMICCILALHHFDDPRRFLSDAASLLKQNGRLSIVAIDPRTIRHCYHYEYFEVTKEMDLRRYPSFGQIVDWMYEAGLAEVDVSVVERSNRRFTGKEVLRDPFLKKESNSMLALLSEEAYAEGLRRLERTLQASGTPMEFRSEMNFCMITGVSECESA